MEVGGDGGGWRWVEVEVMEVGGGGPLREPAAAERHRATTTLCGDVGQLCRTPAWNCLHLHLAFYEFAPTTTARLARRSSGMASVHRAPAETCRD